MRPDLTREQIERLVAEATPGPWKRGMSSDEYDRWTAEPLSDDDGEQPDSWGHYHVVARGRVIALAVDADDGAPSMQNANLIAAAPDLAAFALSRDTAATEAERERDALRKALHAALDLLDDSAEVVEVVLVLRDALKPEASR